jgi:CubicO group peptidase (beta-lactamase class C family)
MVIQASPLQQAMAANGTEAGPEPPAIGADEWLRRLTELPLAFQPGEGWRYHHSFGVLGILISRVTGRPLGQHLAEDVFGPLGMTDTALWVPRGKLGRLPAAYRHGDEGLVETEPAGGGFYAGPPSFDVSHGELVSTARDYHRFAQMLAEGGQANGQPVISADHLQQLTSDQVPAAGKTADSFFPGFWDGMGWGFGVAVQTEGPQRGRIGWAGGQGTDFFVDRDGTAGILLTQVEMGEDMSSLVAEGAGDSGCSADSSFVGGGRLPAVPGEGSSERSGVVEAHGDGHLEDGTVRLGQQGHGAKHASAE